MTTEPLNPHVDLPAYNRRFAENEWGILAAISQCIELGGGQVRSYPANTAGIIRALQDLAVVMGTITGGASILNFVFTLGEPVDAGDALYLNSAGLAFLARADGTRDQATVRAMATTSGIGGAQINACLAGGLGAYSGLSPGAEYYLSASNPGKITTAAPSGSGQFVVKVGEALTDNTLMVQPKIVVELS